MSGGNESTPYTPGLVLLSGLPGAGKTTFARHLADALAVDVIESDAIRRSLAQQPSYSRDESARVFRLVDSRAREALAAGRTPVIDATNVHTNDRRRFLRLARDFDVPVIAIRLVAPDATIRERLSRPRDGFSQADVAIYEWMRTRVRPFTIPLLVVDTRFDLAPSIRAVRQLLSVTP